MSLRRYIREHHRDLDTIEAPAPWHPDGASFVLHVRPDGDSDWVVARARAGVPDPTTYQDRQTAEVEAKAAARRKEAAKLKAQTGNRGGDVQALAGGMRRILEQQAEEPSALPELRRVLDEGWDVRYPIYTPEEVAAVRELVGLYLVVGVDTVSPDGSIEPWEKDRIREAFAETEKVPAALPGEPDDAVPLAGYEEGTAWAIVVLREAVQAHKFLEAAGPLASGSSDSEASPDTSEAERTLTRPYALA